MIGLKHHNDEVYPSIISNFIDCLSPEQGWTSQSFLISNYDHRQQQTTDDNRHYHGHSCRGLPFGDGLISTEHTRSRNMEATFRGNPHNIAYTSCTGQKHTEHTRSRNREPTFRESHKTIAYTQRFCVYLTTK